MLEFKTRMIMEKETKNSIRYSDAGFLGMSDIYIPKSVLYTVNKKAEWPTRITITVEWPEDGD